MLYFGVYSYFFYSTLTSYSVGGRVSGLFSGVFLRKVQKLKLNLLWLFFIQDLREGLVVVQHFVWMGVRVELRGVGLFIEKIIMAGCQYLILNTVYIYRIDEYIHKLYLQTAEQLPYETKLCCFEITISVLISQILYYNGSDNLKKRLVKLHKCQICDCQIIKNMKVFLCFLVLLTIVVSQQFSPKQSKLQINDLYSSDIARDGKERFWKVDGHYWSTIISSKPVPPNSVTKVKIYLQVGATFMIGCGVKDKERMANQFVGQIPNTVSYYTESGRKHKNGDAVQYAQKSMQGDTVTMIIDLREDEKLVKFEKNDRPLGIAYSGLDDWGNIYIMFSIHWVGQKFKILQYSVLQ